MIEFILIGSVILGIVIVVALSIDLYNILKELNHWELKNRFYEMKKKF